ncbi:MAG: helix-turn-helix domain-containing protein [Nannocystaceae bacterium]
MRRRLRGRSAEDAALRRELVAQRRACGGNVSATARAMNKARQQIQKWIRRLEIDRGEYES